jgi:hypothetical protein
MTEMRARGTEATEWSREPTPALAGRGKKIGRG